MKRHASISLQLPDPIRTSVGLPIGDEAAYFVGGTEFFGQGKDCSVLDYNQPPNGQPSLWCDWIPSKDGQKILFDQTREKFYGYVEWLEYLIEHFTKPWGYSLDGKVLWQGEISSDVGEIVITDNRVSVKNNV